MKRAVLFVVSAMCCVATPLIGQEQSSILDRILGAIDLPRIVDSVQARGGIPEEEIRVILGEVMRRGVPAAETGEVLEEADAAIREHGPVDNFGAFVQAQLAQGLRGRALAQAIREEHGRRGIGKGKRRGPKMGPNEGGPGDSIRGGPPGNRGRPDDPGSRGRARRDTTGGVR